MLAICGVIIIFGCFQNGCSFGKGSVLKTDIGFDVKYFGKYTAPSYAPAIGAFYNRENVKFDTYPVIDIFVRTNWKRANLFLRYDYANQGLFSKGYYTVNRYTMPYSLAKFGVNWRFYD